MMPLLFPNTFLETPTYYVLFLFAFLGAILLAARRAPLYGLSPVRAVDLGIVLFIGGVLGGRLMHIVAESPDYYLMHPIRVFYLWQGGFVLFGGVLLAVAFGCIFVRYHGEKIGPWADMAAPSFLLGIGLGRVGCLAAGCCYGSPTNWFWGMVFTSPYSAAPLHIPLHPTQLLEALFCFAAATFFALRFKAPAKIPGSYFVLSLVIYSMWRFYVEFLRGDADRGLYFGGLLSTSQITALGIFVGCIVWFIYFRVRSKNAGQ